MRKIIPFIASLFAVVAVHAGVFTADEDEGPVLRVYNSSPTEDCVIVVVGSYNTNETITVTWGSTVNTITNSVGGRDTVAGLATVLASCTNSTTNAYLMVDSYCSIGTDIVTNYFVANTGTTITAGSWGVVGYWDSSVAKHADLYVPAHSLGGTATLGKLKNLSCSVAGTGSLTLDVYANGSQYYHRVNATNAYDKDQNNVGNYDITIPFNFGLEQSLLFRTARGTTLGDAFLSAVGE